MTGTADQPDTAAPWACRCVARNVLAPECQDGHCRAISSTEPRLDTAAATVVGTMPCLICGQPIECRVQQSLSSTDGPLRVRLVADHDCVVVDEQGVVPTDELPWRVGRKVGRTIYAQVGQEPSDDDPLIGVMDSVVLAEEAVIAHNVGLDMEAQR